MVRKEDIVKAAGQLGIVPGDTVLVHSSFKSLGEVENGADTVVSGLLEAIGPEGTLVFPTLCQKDWAHVYENWHMDAESNVGYLTNYFRKLPGARRSDQATHSVAAMGKDAEYLTETHGKSGKRYGIYGDTPFAADSPWEKMYRKNAKVVFLGAQIYSNTFRHLVEYCYMDELLKSIEGCAGYEQLKDRVFCYGGKTGVWLSVNSETVRQLLDREGKVHYGKCGNADLMCISSAEFVDLALHILRKKDWSILFGETESFAQWVDEVQLCAKEKQKR